MEDVVDAISLANKRGWRVAVGSGGHSWSGSHLRDDGMLLDVSALREQVIDVDARTAAVGPGVRSSDLQVDLGAHDLFFPTGHCLGPCLGGYLLQGGFGWHSRELGPACMSVIGVDVVTASGELIRADAQHHPDLFWAARGAGPGFFGVAVRFHLRLHQRPGATIASAYLYPVELLEEVMRWAHAVAPSVPRSIELMVFMRRGHDGRQEPALQVLAPALADSPEQAREDLRFLEQCPVRDHAIIAQTNQETDVVALVAASDALYPPGYRFAADNMWTHAPIDDLLDGYRSIARTIPSSPSHMMWMNWSPPQARPDMAYSLEDNVYIALYAVWNDPRADQQFLDWPTDRMGELQHASTGIQLADENLGRRAAPFMAQANMARLQKIRGDYDPDGRFHSWMGEGS